MSERERERERERDHIGYHRNKLMIVSQIDRCFRQIQTEKDIHANRQTDTLREKRLKSRKRTREILCTYTTGEVG